MAFGTGILDISFNNGYEMARRVADCEALYNDEIFRLSMIVAELRTTQQDHGYYGLEIDDAAYELVEQIKDYEEKRDEVAVIGKALTVNTFFIESVEKNIANRINENMGEFCDEFGIEYDDPEEYSFGEFLSDAWDGICSVYEKFEATIDFIIDAALFVGAIVGVVIAASALAASGVGVFAIAVLGASVFSLYESTVNFAASTVAFGYAVAGNKEKSKVYLDLRDGNAGKALVVAIAERCGADEKLVGAIYSVIGVGACIVNLADMGRSLVSGGKHLINAAKEAPEVFNSAGKGWNGVKAASSKLFQSCKTYNKYDDIMDAWNCMYTLDKFGFATDGEAILKGMKRLDIFETITDVFDNVRGYVEAEEDPDNGWKKGKEISATISNIPIVDDLAEIASKFFEMGNAIEYEGIRYQYD